jgi:adenine deaminase
MGVAAGVDELRNQVRYNIKYGLTPIQSIQAATINAPDLWDGKRKWGRSS